MRFRHPLSIIFFTALALRLTSALFTTYVIIPEGIFPDYYFSDSAGFHRNALILLEKGNLLHSLDNVPAAHAPYIRLSAFFYMIIGPYPVMMMIFNSAVSSLIVLLIYKIGSEVFDERVGFLAGLIYGLAPSAVFFGSLHMRDSLIALSNIVAVHCVVRILSGTKRPLYHVAGFVLSLFFSGLFRSQMFIFMSAAALLSATAYLFFMKFGPFLKSVALSFLPIAEYMAVKQFFNGPDLSAAATTAITAAPAAATTTNPTLFSDFFGYIAAFRYKFLQANMESMVPPNTILFPDWVPSSFFDVILMELKLIFYILFMPLPFLYPIDGSTGRLFMCSENLLFLTAFLFAVAGFVFSLRDRVSRQSAIFLGAYLASIIAIYAFFAPDLGSAARYKLQYLPIMSIFTAFGVLKLWQKRSSSSM